MVTSLTIESLRSLPTELLLLILAATTASAVSLADFAPQCSDLTPACDAIYTQPITGCSSSDFSATGGSASCSAPCISGMFSMNDAVFNACAGDPANNQNIVQQFIIGRGVQDLCPNVQISTALGGAGGYGTSVVTASVPTSMVTSEAAASSVWVSSPTSTLLSSQILSTPTPYPTQPTTTTLISLPSSSISITPSSTPPILTFPSTPPPSSSTTPTSSLTSALTSTTSSAPTSHTKPPYNNPPTALTGSGTLSMLPTPTLITTGTAFAQPQSTGCVPNGGGGSLIGGKECPSNAAAGAGEKLDWRWAGTGLGIMLVAVCFMGL